MSRDVTITFTADIRPAVAAMKRLRRPLQRIERQVKRIGNGPNPAYGWRHRKSQARR